MNPNIRLVMSDIDGTILNDNHEVDGDLKENLKGLNEKDIPFILASARSPKGMFHIAEELDIIDNPLVCYNGALVLKNADENKYVPIVSHELENEEVRIIIDVIKVEFPRVSINLYSGLNWYVDQFDQWAKIEASITNETPIEKSLQPWLQNANVPVHKLLLIGTPEEIEQLLDHLKSMTLANTSFYLSKENYLEVTHREVSKEKALIEVSDYYHVPLENTMTIGDNFNDIPMLTLAGLGVAMANAPEEVKKNANVKTLSNNDNGASEALKKYILNT